MISFPSNPFSLNHMSAQLQLSFSRYFENWFSKLVQILNELLQIKHNSELVENEEELRALVCKVQIHLKEFYTAKWMAAQDDVLPFFLPIWLTPLEISFLWVTGPKPSTTFRVIDTLKLMRPVTVGSSQIAFDLTEEQNRKIQELRIMSRVEEEKVDREMELLHVSVVTQMVLGDGDAMADMDVLMEGCKAWCRKIVKRADFVRLKTLKDTLQILTPLQRVIFYISYIGLQVRLRLLGKRLLVA